MREQLLQIIPNERIRDRYIDRVSFASDAGFYFMIPKAVVQPVSEQEIIRLFQFSQDHKIPLVFRAAGTSLSGQSITDGILVDLSQYWNNISVEENGMKVRVQPGITGAMVNAYLKKYKRKIGPDPASISAAMMGGILSNNSSGMCCGVKDNSYHTTACIRFILPNGMAFTTEHKADYIRFEKDCPKLYEELISIRWAILKNPHLTEKISKKYLTKNVVGYSLNAFIDHEHPLDILAHLLIGAEGTLAFIAEAVLHTIPEYSCKATALLFYPTINAACASIVPLTASGAMMVELMDRAALRAVEHMPGIPSMVKNLPEDAAALLVEFQANDPKKLSDMVSSFMNLTADLSILNEPDFTEDPKEQELLWKVRKGLFPSVGAVRKSGTTVILEDIAFPVEKLGDAISDLQQLFIDFDYANAIIFGHAKDGNIHFVVTQSLNTKNEIDRYDRFHHALVELVVHKYDGALKAEHGTGRNMAPFVETEWGSEAYAIICRIKEIVDPHGLLNPGVIINQDKQAHIRNMKKLPTVEEEVDRCIECGYCEHKCPSRDITTTPRRRIVIRRVLQQLLENGDKQQYAQLVKEYQYDGLDTCAVDGLCATACPVDINTGDLVKRLRKENHSSTQNRIALITAKYFKIIEGAARVSLKVGSFINQLFGSGSMRSCTKAIRKIIPAMPLWNNQIEEVPSLSILNRKEDPSASIVYFPSCISRTMGTYAGKEKNIMETFLSVCDKTGIAVNVLKDSMGSCCSQIYSSKGFGAAQKFTAQKIFDKLWINSKKGALKIVIDVSSCAYTLHNLKSALRPDQQDNFDKLSILDSIDFLHDIVLPNVKNVNKKRNIVLHPVCSLTKMKTTDKLTRIAEAFAQEVTVPLNAGCCGMAGDRGFLIPELTASAAAAEANEVKQNKYDGYYSSTKTCEMAMTEAVGREYESLLYLIDETIEIQH
ncbi:MAG: FAD-binding and (Fe-S)-binding domain-containing protein [Sphingobacteriales bacterium]